MACTDLNNLNVNSIWNLIYAATIQLFSLTSSWSRCNNITVNLHPWSHEDGSTCISPQKIQYTSHKSQVSRSSNVCISWLKHMVTLVEENLSNAIYNKKMYKEMNFPSNQRFLVVICPKIVLKNLQLTSKVIDLCIFSQELQWNKLQRLVTILENILLGLSTSS